jgi:F0F1-type ATP synthase membrane subunit b/b'
MSDRLQILLLIALTVLGMMCIVGIVIMEMSGHQTVGVLSAIAGAVVVALTGLMTKWGENLKPLTQKVDEMRDAINDNTEMTKNGTDTATENAKMAATNAAEAKSTAQEIKEVMNGNLDTRIKEAVKQAITETRTTQ